MENNLKALSKCSSEYLGEIDIETHGEKEKYN